MVAAPVRREAVREIVARPRRDRLHRHDAVGFAAGTDHWSWRDAPGPAAQPTNVGSVVVHTDIDAKGKFATFAHQYIRDYINLADQKATLFFGSGQVWISM